MQDEEERPTKLQAAVKEVRSTQSPPSINSEKKETTQAASDTLAGCPKVDN